MHWTIQDAVTFLGAVTALVTAIGVAAAKVIQALRGGMQQVAEQLRQHEAASQGRARALVSAVKESAPGEGQ